MMDDWFPGAESKPIGVMDALKNCVIGSYTEPRSYREWTSRLKPGQCVSDIHPKGFGFGVRKTYPDRPAQTIIKTHTPAVGLLHPFEDRFFSIPELKRLGSFPDAFQFSAKGSNTEFTIRAAAWQRIGNSVPPLFMRSIARNIYSMLKTGSPLPKYKKLQVVEDYPAFLDACWQEHLAPRVADAPTVVSTFAGCGGSSLGYSMAGFRELLANEWESNAAETFRLNFHDVPVIQGDIAELSVDQVLEITGLQPGELDVFDGSPPCQGFSTAGKREMTDNRNQLFREYVRLLRGLKPKVFVMENVSGMVKGKMKIIFAEIMRELKASGYKVSARLLNSMYFNVPQSRQRMIFIGVREDLNIEPSHPAAESVPLTSGEVVSDLPVDSLIEATDPKFSEMWKLCKPGNLFSSVHPKKHYFNTYKLNPARPFPTIPKTIFGSGSGGFFHWDVPKIVSIPMLKRGSSYPDGFQFIGKFTEQWARIGNSVPPLFMRAIARHIRREILEKI